MRLASACHGWHRGLAVVAVMAVGTVLPAVPATAAGARTYRAIDLGVNGFAADVNDRGQVVGGYSDADAYRPFLWQRGRLTDLGGLAPGPVQSGSAVAINNRGQVAGHSATDPEMPGGHAFRWQPGVMTDLGTLGGGNSFASEINDRGQIIGFSETGAVEERHGFLWQNGVLNDLGRCAVVDINDRGQMIGAIWGVGTSGSVLWDHGRVVDLPFSPRAINNHGWIVGSDTDSGDGREHAYLWRSGTVTDLGMLDPDFPDGHAAPVDINDRGEVLGTSNVSKREHVFLWRRGTMIDLARYGIPVETYVGALNNRGDIAAASSPVQGVTRAVLYQRR